MAIKGTKGDDILSGTSGNDVFDLWQGGNDTVSGGDGNDIFKFGAAFTADDKIDGGTGKDTLVLKGDYSGGVVFAADTMVNVETVKLLGFFDYNLTINDATVAAGDWLTVHGEHITGGHQLTFNGAADTDGHLWVVGSASDDLIIGGGGNDVLVGGAGADVFDLSHGGHDQTNGGTGDDTFKVGRALTAGDQINGASGNDTLILNGDYSDGLVLGAATIQQIETLQFGRNHDYNLTSADANIAIHATLIVDATALGARDTISFDGTAETNGVFVFEGGAGENFFSGGAGNDQFDFVASAFNEGTGGAGNDIFSFGGDNANVDQVDGGSGSNSLVFNGEYTSLNLPDSAVANIQTIFFEGSDTYSGVAIAGDISGGAPVTIRADTMLAGGSLALDASASANAIHFDGGVGLYTITGSGQDDVFNGGAGFTALDSIDGGGGNDTLALDGDYSLGIAPGTISGIATITLAAGHDYNLSTADDNVAPGDTLTIDGSALGAGDSFTFFGTAETDGSFYIVSRAGNAQLTGGDGDDTFDVGADAFNPNVHFDGSAGNDTLVLDGVYPTEDVGVFSIFSIETVKVAAGHSYDLTENVPGVLVGNIDASSLGVNDHLIFDSGSNNGGVTIRSGAGADQLIVSTVAANTFIYEGIPLSGDTRDTLMDFDFSGQDKIAFHTVNAVDTLVFGGALDNANFDPELAADIGASQLHAGDAVLFVPDTGDLFGHTFLIIDGNGVAGYQAGSDLVIDLNGNLPSLTTANFIA